MLKERHRLAEGVASRIGAVLSIGLLSYIAMACTAGRGHAAEEPGTMPPSAAGDQYQGCLAGAVTSRDKAYAAECKRLAEQTDSDRANCLAKLNLPKIYCDASYAQRDPTPACALPDKVASVIEAELARARFRCARVLKGEEGKL
jgi:hypothetical protein